MPRKGGGSDPPRLVTAQLLGGPSHTAGCGMPRPTVFHSHPSLPAPIRSIRSNFVSSCSTRGRLDLRCDAERSNGDVRGQVPRLVRVQAREADEREGAEHGDLIISTHSLRIGGLGENLLCFTLSFVESSLPPRTASRVQSEWPRMVPKATTGTDCTLAPDIGLQQALREGKERGREDSHEHQPWQSS